AEIVLWAGHTARAVNALAITIICIRTRSPSYLRLAARFLRLAARFLRLASCGFLFLSCQPRVASRKQQVQFGTRTGGAGFPLAFAPRPTRYATTDSYFSA